MVFFVVGGMVWCCMVMRVVVSEKCVIVFMLLL